MVSPELHEYVATMRSRGYSDDSIRTALSNGGYPGEVISEALGEASALPPPPPSNSKRLVGVVAICALLVIAAGFFIAYTVFGHTNDAAFEVVEVEDTAAAPSPITGAVTSQGVPRKPPVPLEEP